MHVNTLVKFFLGAVTAYIITFLAHGYAHAVASFIYGQNDSPWIIPYGNLWLQSVTENVEYHALFQQGELRAAGIIGISGYLVNWLILTFAVFRINKTTKPCTFAIDFYYWLAIWNLTAVFNYTPLHVLQQSTSVTHDFHEMGISIWMLYFLGGVASLCMIYLLFFKIIYQIFGLLNIQQRWLRWLYFLLPLVLVLFFSTFRYLSRHFGMYYNIFDIAILIKIVALAIIIYASDIEITDN